MDDELSERGRAQEHQRQATREMGEALAAASRQAIALARTLLDPANPRPGNAWAMLKIASKLGRLADKTTSTDVEMCEGVEGYRHYHLRAPSSASALCRAAVMSTGCKVWGLKSHLNERYCKICERKAGLMGKPTSPG